MDDHESAPETPIEAGSSKVVVQGKVAKSYRKVWIAVASVSGIVAVAGIPTTASDDVRTTAIYAIAAVASVAITGNSIEQWKDKTHG